MAKSKNRRRKKSKPLLYKVIMIIITYLAVWLMVKLTLDLANIEFGGNKEVDYLGSLKEKTIWTTRY